MSKPALKNPPKAVRSAPIYFSEAGGTLSEDGRIIRGISLIKPGVEARGHGWWIDEVTCSQVLAECLAAGAEGVKAHLGHGALSDDAINRHIGQFSNFRDDNGTPRGDLTFEGINPDLERKVLLYATKHPRQAGPSIAASYPDFDAMNTFMSANLDAQGRFRSPDPRNKKNLPHLRIPKGELNAIDIVARPAANPEGMFGELEDSLFEARGVVLYALGLSEEMPEELLGLNIHPSRIRGFFQRILDDENLEIRPISAPEQEELTMSEQKTAQEKKETPAKDAPAGKVELAAGDTVTLAQLQAQLTQLSTQVATLSTENATLKEQNINMSATLLATEKKSRLSECLALASSDFALLPGGLSLEAKATMLMSLDALPKEPREVVLKVLKSANDELGMSSTRAELGPKGERALNLGSGDVFAEVEAELKKVRERDAKLSDRDAYAILFREKPDLHSRYIAASTVNV